MKYALVTGASSGIGKEIAIKLASDHGYHVLVNYCNNAEGAKKTVEQIEKNGNTAEIIQFDVKDKNAVERSLNNWNEKNPETGFEVVVNNAGIVNDELMMFMDDEKWDSVMDIKLKGFYYVTRFTLQKMILNRYGRIINVASILGIMGNRGQVNYSAANGGLIAATKALAREVGNRNITVNAVAPGFIKTGMTAHLPESELKKIIPAGRFGTSEEVADVVSFLASKKASYVNGEVISISGGM